MSSLKKPAVVFPNRFNAFIQMAKRVASMTKTQVASVHKMFQFATNIETGVASMERLDRDQHRLSEEAKTATVERNRAIREAEAVVLRVKDACIALTGENTGTGFTTAGRFTEEFCLESADLPRAVYDKVALMRRMNELVPGTELDYVLPSANYLAEKAQEIEDLDNDAKVKREQRSVMVETRNALRTAVTQKLRCIRSYAFSIHRTNPMRVSEFGFVVTERTSNMPVDDGDVGSNGGSGSDPEPNPMYPGALLYDASHTVAGWFFNPPAPDAPLRAYENSDTLYDHATFRADALASGLTELNVFQVWDGVGDQVADGQTGTGKRADFMRAVENYNVGQIYIDLNESGCVRNNGAELVLDEECVCLMFGSSSQHCKMAQQGAIDGGHWLDWANFKPDGYDVPTVIGVAGAQVVPVGFDASVGPLGGTSRHVSDQQVYVDINESGVLVNDGGVVYVNPDAICLMFGEKSKHCELALLAIPEDALDWSDWSGLAPDGYDVAPVTFRDTRNEALRVSPFIVNGVMDVAGVQSEFGADSVEATIASWFAGSEPSYVVAPTNQASPLVPLPLTRESCRDILDDVLKGPCFSNGSVSIPCVGLTYGVGSLEFFILSAASIFHGDGVNSTGVTSEQISDYCESLKPERNPQEVTNAAGEVVIPSEDLPNAIDAANADFLLDPANEAAVMSALSSFAEVNAGVDLAYGNAFGEYEDEPAGMDSILAIFQATPGNSTEVLVTEGVLQAGGNYDINSTAQARTIKAAANVLLSGCVDVFTGQIDVDCIRETFGGDSPEDVIVTGVMGDQNNNAINVLLENLPEIQFTQQQWDID